MEDIVFFGESTFRNQRLKFGIKTDDRRRHIYVIGQTGTGKTTLLENMTINDIRAGRGVGVIDPHGEYAEKMLDYIPKERIKDVIYFNPADLDFPMAFNVMEEVPPEYRHLVGSGLVGVFKKLWAESWGPRLEYVLRNAIMALLEYPGSTLLGIMRMFVDKMYRKEVISKIQDPIVKAFWNEEFAKYPDRFMAEAVAPIQNKVGQFLTIPLIRNVIGQKRSAINLRKIMDEKKIFIANLSKGKIGEDSSSLLGGMLVTKLQLAAMSRADISTEAERQDFYLYVDEFQNFATESFANILSEARKYRLNIILAHQYIAQMPEIIRDAIFGNVGTFIVFRVGDEDAEVLETKFSPDFTAQDIINSSNYNMYLKLMIDGMPSRGFSAIGLPPLAKQEVSYKNEIVAFCRNQYATPKSEVESSIASEWLREEKPRTEQSSTTGENIKEERYAEAAGQPQRQTYDARCWICGKSTEVPFIPDNKRPIYCKDCLKAVKAGEIKPAQAPRQLERDSLASLRSGPEAASEAAKKIISSEAVVKEIKPGVSFSTLKDSALREKHYEREKEERPKKERKGPDLDSLRKTLEESLRKLK